MLIGSNYVYAALTAMCFGCFTTQTSAAEIDITKGGSYIEFRIEGKHQDIWTFMTCYQNRYSTGKFGTDCKNGQAYPESSALNRFCTDLHGIEKDKENETWGFLCEARPESFNEVAILYFVSNEPITLRTTLAVNCAPH